MKTTIKEYRENPALGSSDLRQVLKNAKKFNLIKTGQLDPTTFNMKMGQLFHCALLEPEKLEDLLYIGVPLEKALMEIVDKVNTFDHVHVLDVESKRVGEWQKKKKEIEDKPNERLVTKEEWESIQLQIKNKDKIIVSQDKLDDVHKWVAKTKTLPHMADLLERGEKEETFFGEISGVPVKTRIDLLFRRGENKIAVFEFKTIDDECTPDACATASGREFYFMQESLQRWILMQNGFEIEEYKFVFTSKEEWSGSGFFYHDERSRLYGDKFIEFSLEKFKHCKEKNLWLENEYNYQENKFEFESMMEIPVYVTKKFPGMEMI